MFTTIIIAVLVGGLSSEDFSTREWSSAALGRLGEIARPALVKAVNRECPEARARASNLLTQLRNQNLNSFRPFPPIDGMWYCDKKFGYVSVSDGGECAAARQKYGHYLEWAQAAKLESADGDYPTFRRATRRVVEEWLDEGKSDEWIRERLADITRRDNLWRLKTDEERRRRMRLMNFKDVPPPGVPMIMPGPMGVGVPWFPTVINAKDAVIK